MTSFVAPELRPEPPPRRPATIVDPKSWRCCCGHPLYEHSLRRVSGTSEQQHGPCHVEGCDCAKGVSEVESNAGAVWPVDQGDRE